MSDHEFDFKAETLGCVDMDSKLNLTVTRLRKRDVIVFWTDKQFRKFTF